MRFWHRSLVRIFGANWVREHVTVYADDNHLCWVFTTPEEVHRAMSQAEKVLHSFGDFGMRLNVDKTVALVCFRGNMASSLRKRYVRKGDKPHLVLGDSLLIPIVQHHVYLGICVSYGSFAKKTLVHRRKCSMGAYTTLRQWWSPSKLTLPKRVLLWKVCVWTSLTYGLVEVGLSSLDCRFFRQIVFKNLRWIARSPCHITKESNTTLLKRLELKEPLLMLALMVVKLWTNKLVQCTCLGAQDILHEDRNCSRRIHKFFTGFSSASIWLRIFIRILGHTTVHLSSGMNSVSVV